MIRNPERRDPYAPALPPVLPPVDLRAQFSPWWGDTAAGGAGSPTIPATPSAADSVAEYTPYVSLAKQLFSSDDPREEAAVLEQKIANYKKMRSIAPYSIIPGRVWYDNEIAKMQARLAVLKREILPEQQRTQAALSQYRALGTTVLGIGAVLGLALVGLVVAKTARTVRGG
jgi:hypothetical protein